MGVDQEVENIYEAIYNINGSLSTFSLTLGNFIEKMDNILGGFDNKVLGVVDKVNQIGDQTTSFMNHFPSSIAYLLTIFLVVIVLNLLSVWLIYYIYLFINEREIRFDRQVRLYRKQIYRMLPEEDFYNADTTSINSENYIKIGP
ncbi:hypothetical protein WR25_02186 [Diploscapter pachys]|uniref:Uncharacterized protein n=1 Tax=Diploscapter pachys TaxID=2018661 RepID=A0A2A2KR22_9BILA|nr:hypothetical protein WR25_02186 [Diploscapter pachys]